MQTRLHLERSRLASPLGEMLLLTDEQQSIRALDFADHRSHLRRALPPGDCQRRQPQGLRLGPAPQALAAGA